MIQLGECLSKRKDTNDLKIARTCIVFKISYETTTCTIRTNTHTHTHTHTHLSRTDRYAPSLRNHRAHVHAMKTIEIRVWIIKARNWKHVALKRVRGGNLEDFVAVIVSYRIADVANNPRRTCRGFLDGVTIKRTLDFDERSQGRGATRRFRSDTIGICTKQLEPRLHGARARD